MHHPSNRFAHTVAFVIPVVEYWLEREATMSNANLTVHNALSVLLNKTLKKHIKKASHNPRQT